MTPAERRQILGDAAVAEIHRRADLAPPPPPEFVESLRRMLAPTIARMAADGWFRSEHPAAA